MKIFIPILIIILFLGILIGGDIYLSKRLAYFFNIEKIKVLYIGIAVVIIFMIAGMLIFTNSTIYISSIIYGTAAILTGFLLYLLLSTIAIDLLSLFIKIPPKWQGIIALSLAVIISAYGIWNAQQMKVTKRTVELSGLEEDIKAVHLSDIHLGHFRGKEFLESIVKKTNEHSPDIVFITGDLFDGKIRLNKDVLSPLKNMSGQVYFVEGNHDIYSGVNKIKTYLKDIGVHVLENDVKVIKGLQIIGLNHMRSDENTHDMHAQKGQTIKDVLHSLKINKDTASVLLHHSPDGINYAYEKGIDLYLSGHTHAGQIFPINFITRLVYKYSRGDYNFNDLKIIVSEGTGTWGPPMRIGTKSEIIVLNLKNNNR